MTDTTAPASDAETAASVPDRTVPQALIDLAVLAIKRGSPRVFLGHEGMGYEFQAPIGWIMWISEAGEKGVPKERAHMIIHQIGDGFDKAVLPEGLADDTVQEQPVIDELVDLFQDGVKNGWSMTYERRVLEHKSWLRTVEKHGIENELTMRHELRGQASNWSYDEAAQKRGDHVSTEVTFSNCEGSGPDPFGFSNDGGTHRQVDPSHVAALLRAPAPNTVPVAYFDDEQDEWVK